MAEAATALLALWNDVAPPLAGEYDDWHAREHVPERLTVPGMLWGHRFGRVSPGGMPAYLTLYGLRDAEVLDSEPYRRLLREPTPMSARMRPALVNISRWVCTLHAHDGLDRGNRLVVRTSTRRPADASRGDRLGQLLAERRDDAAPLPWLDAGQSAPVEGRWLHGVTFDDTSPAGETPAASDAEGKAVAYHRLPVG